MHLGGQRHRAVLGHREPVRGAALGSAGPSGCAGAGIDADQPEGLQLGGDRSGGGAGDPEFGRQHGAGRGTAGVDELQRRPERTATPFQPGPRSRTGRG